MSTVNVNKNYKHNSELVPATTDKLIQHVGSDMVRLEQDKNELAQTILRDIEDSKGFVKMANNKITEIQNEKINLEIRLKTLVDQGATSELPIYQELIEELNGCLKDIALYQNILTRNEVALVELTQTSTAKESGLAKFEASKGTVEQVKEAKKTAMNIRDKRKMFTASTVGLIGGYGMLGGAVAGNINFLAASALVLLGGGAIAGVTKGKQKLELNKHLREFNGGKPLRVPLDGDTKK
jgi:hypothetical protein